MLNNVKIEMKDTGRLALLKGTEEDSVVYIFILEGINASVKNPCNGRIMNGYVCFR